MRKEPSILICARGGGLFEGEGCILIEQSSSITLEVPSITPATVQWLEEHFGGTVSTQNRLNASDGYNRQPIYRWRVRRSDESCAFLRRIYPFAGMKQEQIDVALEFRAMQEIRLAEKRHRYTDAERERIAFLCRVLPQMKRPGIYTDPWHVDAA